MAFKPEYKLTNKILNNISEITITREFIEHSRLIPKWEFKLKKEARIHNAHSSTSIEGNRLSLKEVESLSEHKKVIASAKDKQEVTNYLKALDGIPKYSFRDKLDTKLLLKIHKHLTHKTLKELKHSGTFRSQQVFVGKRVFDGTQLKTIVEYMPPKTKDVPRLVSEFLDWLGSKEAKKIHPILLSGITHYEIARIHPFIDGNGRTARLVAALILYKSGFDHRRFFALDDYYDQNRPMYYAALKTAQNTKNDITEWLEYFTDGVLYSASKVKDAITKLGIAHKVGDTERIELTPRQIRILEKMKEKGKITNKDLRATFNVSRQAILKEISKLTKAKLIELVGKGRNAYYKIAE